MRRREVLAMRIVTSLVAIAVLSLGCGGEVTPSTVQAAQGLQCPAGQFAYNYTAAGDPFSSEGVGQAGPDAGLPGLRLKSNRLTILSASCDNNLDWTDLFKDACEGRFSCDYENRGCRAGGAAIRVKYACSAAPQTEYNKVCDVPSDRCLFSLSCPDTLQDLINQSIVAAADAGSNTVCVPEHCNSLERRDKQLGCVFDDTRPEEWEAIEPRLVARRPPQMSMLLRSEDLTLVTPSVRADANPSFGGTRMRLDRTKITYFKSNDVLTNAAFNRLRESDLSTHRVLIANAKYRLKSDVFYVVPPGKPNNGMQGVVTLWVSDEYGPDPSPQRGFRCVLHSVDMSKYGPGTVVDANDPDLKYQYKVSIDEEFVIPRDCAEDSPAQKENEGMLARRNGLTTLAFLNSVTHKRTMLNASYNLDGRVAIRDPDQSVACATNPLGFFYDAKGGAPDRYAYYSQEAASIITFNFAPRFDPPIYASGLSVRRNEIFVQEANQTTIGVSAVRPKKLSFKVDTVGPAHGFMRVDADWYLNGDLHRFWGRVALRNDNYPATLVSYLVPLDAAGNAQPSETHRMLTQIRVFESSGYGATAALKIPIDEELRAALQKPGSAIEIPPDSGRRNFKLKVCVLLKNDANFYEPSIYTLVRGPDACRTTDAPFEIRLDRSVTFLPSLDTGGFDNSEPASSGDNRMSQNSDNDQSTGCDVRSLTCRLATNQRLEGLGMFGRTMFEMKVSIGGQIKPSGEGEVSAFYDIKLLGFTVLGADAVPMPTTFTANAKKTLSIPIDIPWDTVAKKLRERFPSNTIDIRDGQITATAKGAIDGVYVGYEFVIPVRYGPLQGYITFTPSAGAGASPSLDYTFTPNTNVSCTPVGDAGTCAGQFVEQPPMTLRDATNECYIKGGQLADLTTQEQHAQLTTMLDGGTGPYWLGAQVANRYAENDCQTNFVSARCILNHTQSMRWLSNDEDFAFSKAFGDFTLVNDGGIYLPPAGYAVGRSSTPVNSGVILATGDALRAPLADESFRSVCALQNATKGFSQRFQLNTNIGAAAGMLLSFCTPSRMAGVCLEGRMNFIEVKVNPFLAYTAHALTDRLNRIAIRSAVSFGLDVDLKLLTGKIDFLIKFWDFYTYRYNLVSFDGIQQFFARPGTTVEKIIPLKDDFQ